MNKIKIAIVAYMKTSSMIDKTSKGLLINYYRK
jgi:hypothetical protein